jgi:nitrogen-specific signal transduction histidine kinase
MHSYAPYQRDSTVRRRSRAFEGSQPNSALSVFVAALDVTTEAALIVDRSGTIVHANSACETLLCCTDLIGRRVASLYPLTRRSLRRMLSDLRNDGVWRDNLQLQGSGTRLEAAVALRAVPLTAGRPRYFCLVGRARTPSDASVLSAVGRVAGEIAHDFNNQIAVVINYSSILLRQLPDDSPLRDHVTEMQSAAWRASQVAQEMLGFGGQRSVETDDIDLNALLGDVQALFAYALREDTRLELRLAENLWRVRARRAHLEWLLVEVASRMRATLGPIESFDITTSNSDAVQNQTQDQHEDQAQESTRIPRSAGSVVISVEARARRQPAAGADGGSTSPRLSASLKPAAQRLGPGSSGLRGAELALAHAHGELTMQPLPDGALRYRIRLPAVYRAV